MSFSWRGVNAFNRKVSGLSSKLQRNVVKAMTEVVQETHAEAIPITPRDTGKLRETSRGRVSNLIVSRGTWDGTQHTGQMETMGKTLKGTVGYTTDYALEVHESPPRNWTTPGTGAKYLETASVGRREANMKLFRNAAKDL